MQARTLGEKQQDASCRIPAKAGILEAVWEAGLEAVWKPVLEAVPEAGLKAVLGVAR
jgi:hypothetical protein